MMVLDAKYWNAAALAMDHVRSIGCGTKTIRTYDRRIRQLADYLDSQKVPFTREEAWRWCAGGDSRPCKAIIKERKATVRLIADAYENGAVSRSCQSHPGYGCYRELSGWAKDAVDGFVGALPEGTTAAYAKAVQANVSGFLVGIGANGDAGPERITACAVLGYVDADNGAKATRCAKLCNVRAFLRHLAKAGECGLWAAILADDAYARCRELYGLVVGWDGPGAMAPEAYLDSVEEFMRLVEKERYSRTVCSSFRRLLTYLYVAMSVNGIGYSAHGAELWLEANAERFGKQIHSYRRALFLFMGFIATGKVDACSVRRSRSACMDDFPSWSQLEVSGYLELRAREGYADSTVGCIRRALLRFARYAVDRGAAGWGDITPVMVSGWCLSDPHSTAEGRACYTAKVRCFLEYLGDEGLVADSLSLAVCSQSAPRRGIAKVLDDGQVVAASERRRTARTPMELRDAAMVAIGLTMGLRASDVLGLDLADISWSASIVTIVQRKTLRQLNLPLTTAAGNAIAAYVRGGRPKLAATSRLFVRHKAPYTPLTRSACAAACRRTFGDDVAFHDLRRTYATRMLRGGASRHGVAEALGHSDDGTVDKYLSIDDARMPMCAMSLSELGLEAPGHGL